MLKETSVPVGNDVNARRNQVKVDFKLTGLPVKNSMTYKSMTKRLVGYADSEIHGEGAAFMSRACRAIASAMADSNERDTAEVSCEVFPGDIYFPSLIDISGMLRDVDVSMTISQHGEHDMICEDEAEEGYWNHVTLEVKNEDVKSFILGHNNGEMEALVREHEIDDLSITGLAGIRAIVQQMVKEEAEKRRVAQREQTVHEIIKTVGEPEKEDQFERGK